MKKLLALALTLTMALTLLAGCGGSDSSSGAPANDGTSTASSLSAAVSAKGEKVKMGILIWGTTDALGRNSTMMVQKLVDQVGGEVVIDSSYTSPETQIQSAENLIAGGCNAILIVNSSDTCLLYTSSWWRSCRCRRPPRAGRGECRAVGSRWGPAGARPPGSTAQPAPRPARCV